MSTSLTDADASRSDVNKSEEQQRSSGTESDQPGASVRVGTVAELIAQGPAPPCAGCTRAQANFEPGAKIPQMDGLFSQASRGWVILCNTHKCLVRDQETLSYSAPQVVPHKSYRAVQQPVVTSISERWKKQQMKKTRQTKKKGYRTEL